MSIYETSTAPVEHGRHIYYTRTHIDRKTHALPFTTRKVVLAELKKGDVIAEEYAWETEDVVILYKVVRINKKTISVMDCDECGHLVVSPYRTGKSKVNNWAGRTFNVVNV